MTNSNKSIAWKVINGIKANDSVTKTSKDDINKIKEFVFDQEKVLALIYPDETSYQNVS